MSAAEIREREWEYFPEPDGEPYMRGGRLVVGWENRRDGQDPDTLRAEFEAYEGHPLVLVPILCRFASEVECKINGWEDGTFVDCTSRAKNPMPMWRIEHAPPEHLSEGAPG